MDWRLERAIYEVSLHHHWVGALFHGIEQASIPVMVVITAALWFVGRRSACVYGFLSAAVAYVLAFVIHHIYDRPRPYESHAIAHPWSSSTDASFPSDHATVSFGIAFAVLAFDRVAGAVFLVVAAVIGVGRLFIGAHYPGDVLMGAAVGAVAAVVTVRLLRRVVPYPKRPVT
jgi:undecaprenyl-diphosphatase